MIACSRLMVMSVVGILVGSSPILAAAPKSDPIEATTHFGATCTKSIAKVMSINLPLCKDVMQMAQWFAAHITTPSTSSVPAADAAMMLGGKAFEVSFQSTGIGDPR